MQYHPKIIPKSTKTNKSMKAYGFESLKGVDDDDDAKMARRHRRRRENHRKPNDDDAFVVERLLWRRAKIIVVVVVVVIVIAFGAFARNVSERRLDRGGLRSRDVAVVERGRIFVSGAEEQAR